MLDFATAKRRRDRLDEWSPKVKIHKPNRLDVTQHC